MSKCTRASTTKQNHATKTRQEKKMRGTKFQRTPTSEVRKKSRRAPIAAGSAFTAEQCQKRWKALRERFGKEAKRRKGQTGKKKRRNKTLDSLRTASFFERLHFSSGVCTYV